MAVSPWRWQEGGWGVSYMEKQDKYPAMPAALITGNQGPKCV